MYVFSFRSERKDQFPFNKGVWNIERAFQISWKKKAAIPNGGLNDYGIPKAWGGGKTVWNSEGKGGLSILEFPKARGGLDEDAARGRVWIFSGITQFETRKSL